jgi:hypothetical protein
MKMKKTGIVICLVTVIIMALSSLAYAADTGLEILETTPKDGQKNTSAENMSVKIIFSEPVNSEKNRKANDACLDLVDEDGKSLPIKVYYNNEETEMVLILLDKNAIAEKNQNSKDKKKKKQMPVKDNAVYELKISKGFQANSGNKLSADKNVSFKTINQSFNTKIYMFMMFGMMGLMFFFSSKAAKKQAEEDIEGSLVDQMPPFNPYKEAKRTGKSVEEVIAEHEKELAKMKAKDKKRQAKREEFTEEYLNAIEEKYAEKPKTYKVKTPRPINAAGGKYKGSHYYKKEDE